MAERDTLIVLETSFGQFGLAPLRAAQQLGLRTVLLTSDPQRYRPTDRSAAALRSLATEVRQLDTGSVDAVLEALQPDLDRLSGVYSMSDYSVHIAALVAQRLGLPGLAPEAALVARDKWATLQACSREGVPTAAFRRVTSPQEAVGFAAEIGYPCVVKPMTEAGSIGVRLCRTPTELRAAYAAVAGTTTDFRGGPKPDGVLVEEYIVGLEVSVEVIIDAAGVVVLGVTDKSLGPHPHFIKAGAVFPSVLPDPVRADALDVALAALAAVGHDFGAAHVELKITAAGPRLIEVNPRMAGAPITELVSAATGVDVVQEVVRRHCGLPGMLAAGPVPVIRGAAARLIFMDRAGTVTDIRGVGLARRVPGVITVQLDTELGGKVEAATSGMDTMGHVLAIGSSAGEATRRADSAVGQITIELTSS